MSRTYRRSFYQGNRLTPAERKETRLFVERGHQSYPAIYRNGGGEKRHNGGKQISMDQRATRRFGDVVKFDWADERGSKQEASRNRRLADQAACEAGLEELESDRQADWEDVMAGCLWDGYSVDEFIDFCMDDRGAYDWIYNDDFIDDYDFMSGKY